MTAVLGDTRGSVVGSRNRVRQHIGRLLWLVAAADLLVLWGSVLSAWQLRMNLDVWTMDSALYDVLPRGAALTMILLWMTFLVIQGAYSPRFFGAGQDEFKVVYLASVITAGSTGMLFYLFKLDISRGFVVLTFFLGIPMLLAERYLVRKMVHRVRAGGRLHHRVLAVGGPSAITEVAEVLRRERHVGYEICGACVPAGIQVDEGDLPVPHLGAVEDTRRLADELGADTVLVARGGYASAADLRRIAWDLEGSDIDLVVVPSLTDVAGPRIHMRPVAGLPLLHVEGPQVDEAGGVSKRMFDLVGALLILLVVSPVMLVTALAIRLEDRGSIFYRQKRIGLDGEPFDCFKFRSMYLDADKKEAELRAAAQHEGALFKLEKDPRITRIGGFIRRFSIDELPQLFNVVRGDMSLVGPRPQQAWEVETYNDSMRRRLLVRPGMTGLWQVSGRSSLSWNEAVRLDLYYVDNWSMITDLAIIAKTVKAVLGRDGAY